RYGIVGLAGATAVSASVNCLLLYTVLHRRGWFHFTAKLAGRIARQLVAVAAMAALLLYMMPLMQPFYGGNAFERIWSLAILVAAGGMVFFAAAFATGALDKDLLAMLTRRRRNSAVTTKE
ncbi:polysaccharide biosynthesis C-terminal domain-containing protein, partial [Sphingopyxis sp.]